MPALGEVMQAEDPKAAMHAWYAATRIATMVYAAPRLATLLDWRQGEYPCSDRR